ncbi:MAG: class I adenylate-forming enzyme family protein [Desulfobacterales bacterium]|nr:class I adenylate-forming enzyme family protein [Desulfobacterales bacterium]
MNEIYLKNVTLSNLWKRNAAECPDKVALVDSKTRLTWQAADIWIDRLALGLIEKNFNKNDVLVVQLPNCVFLNLFRVACERAGCLCLPLNIAFRRKEQEYTLRFVNAKGVVIPHEFRNFNFLEAINTLSRKIESLKHIFVVGDPAPEGAISVENMVSDPIEKRYPENFLERTQCSAMEFSTIMTTTGTTGFPKFVEYPICSRMQVAKELSEKWEFTDQDVVAILAPSGGGPNVAGYLAAPLVKAGVVILEHFDSEEALNAIANERVTIVTAVPTMLIKMIAHPDFKNYDLTRLRLIVSAGASIPFETAQKVEKMMGAPIVQFYGSVDSALNYVTLPKDSQEVRLRTVGKLAGKIDVQLIDDEGAAVSEGETGEIVCRCRGEFSGYFNDMRSTLQAWDADGWFRMGDLGRLDEQGNMRIVGRKKDMIIRGGQNIFPFEIEDMLSAHSKIRDVSIIGIPDREMGERACACIVANCRDEKISLKEIVAFLKQKGVSAYKLPERIEIIDQMPMVAGGQKKDKKALVHRVLGKMKAEGINLL